MNLLIVGVMCAATFTHDHQREDGTVMNDNSFSHELYVNDIKKPMHIVDNGIDQFTILQWWENGDCPSCELIKMKTIDTDGWRSIYSTDACPSPAKPPGICQ